MRSFLRHLQPVDVGAALYAAAYFAWLSVRPAGTATSQLIGGVVFYPLGVAAAWSFWRASRLPDLDGRTRAAWRCLIVMALMLFTSGTAWDVYRQVARLEDYPAWVDDLETGCHLFEVAAFLLFPGRALRGANRTRLLLDISLVVVAGSAVALYFGGRLWLADPLDHTFEAAFRGPGMDWLVLVMAAIGTVQKRDRSTRSALALLVVANVFYVLANYYYTVGPGSVSYRTGDSVDALWFLAWVFRWIAGRWPCYARAMSDGVGTRVDAAADEERGGVSYLVVAGCFMLLTMQVFSRDPSFALLSVSAAVTTTLMMLRQLVELRENRRLLDEQAAQETRFRSLVGRSSDVVLILDGQGIVEYVSAPSGGVLGPVPIEAGTRLASVVRDDDRPLIESALSSAGGAGRLLLHVRGRADTWREIEAVWSDQRHEPAVNGIVVNCRDVTHRRELERQLQHAQKLDAVGQLAGGLAHDINNSLAIVRGYAELLRDGLSPGSTAASDLAHVQHAVDRAAAITRKVLAFSRRQVTQPSVFDLSAVVADLLPLLRQSVSPQIDVQLKLERHIWAVRADRGQMEQVLLNLATNARDAMPDGGVVTVVTANRTLSPEEAAAVGLSAGDYVTLAVHDRGQGMTPAVQARIFEPFFSTKSSTGGMGLGLAMVHDIVRTCGGAINVVSSPNQGSTFTILLPRTREHVPVEGGAARHATPALGKTVLLVDDEEKVRAVARRMLERRGYSVVEAPGGTQALSILADPGARLDFLLTDLVMPGIDGRHLIARCSVVRPLLPIVCMTGFAGEQDAPLGPAGRVTVLSKPFSIEGLLDALGTAASRSVES